MQSVVTFVKPLPHLSQADWEAALNGVQVGATTRRMDAFDLRYSTKQLRNEMKAKTNWDIYHNNNRLKERIRELEEWRSMFQDLMDRMNSEIFALKDEKASTERELEQLNVPLLICSESLSSRDSRADSELAYDIADTELKRELCVTESNKKMLVDRCQATWEKINRMEAVKFKLQLHLNNLKDTLEIDNEMLNLDDTCASITHKTDPLKTPAKMLTYDQWVVKSEGMKKMVSNELAETLKAREAMFVGKCKARNMLRAQTDSTNYMLRRRIYETQRARNEVQWQKRKMEEEMQKLAAEMKALDDLIYKSISALKIAETRLETRGYRPGVELAADEANIGIKNEVRSLRETIHDMQDRLNCCKATYNALSAALDGLSRELENKEYSLDTDIRILESRAAVEPKLPEGTEKNLVLANIDDDEPKHVPGAT